MRAHNQNVHSLASLFDSQPSVRRVSFFGVRQIALVDMPDNAGEFVQRVGRAVRFNGHAGLPPEKSNVRVRLYCATLGGDDDDDDDKKGGITKSADEKQLQSLKVGLQLYDKELRSLYAAPPAQCAIICCV